MRCPFLRESVVHYCGAAAFRKMIIRPTDPSAEEICSTPAWEGCLVALERGEEHAGLTRCPYIHESLVQFCSASPVPKYIPYSEAQLSRCVNDGHRYCELYTSLAHEGESGGAGEGAARRPEGRPAQAGSRRSDDRPPHPEGSRRGRAFSRNHLWLDEGRDGTCHVGIDAFLARVLGSVDRVTFLTSAGRGYPAAVLTAAGADLTCVFPRRLNVTAANTYLRAHPERLTSDPYTLGWLFEGTLAPAESDTLLRGKEADAWLESENARLNTYVHEECARGVMDGGEAVAGVIRYLRHEQIIRLYNEFFGMTS